MAGAPQLGGDLLAQGGLSPSGSQTVLTLGSHNSNQNRRAGPGVDVQGGDPARVLLGDQNGRAGAGAPLRQPPNSLRGRVVARPPNARGRFCQALAAAIFGGLAVGAAAAGIGAGVGSLGGAVMLPVVGSVPGAVFGAALGGTVGFIVGFFASLGGHLHGAHKAQHRRQALTALEWAGPRIAATGPVGQQPVSPQVAWRNAAPSQRPKPVGVRHSTLNAHPTSETDSDSSFETHPRRFLRENGRARAQVRKTFPQVAESSRRLKETAIRRTQRQVNDHFNVLIGNNGGNIEAYDAHVSALENETRIAAENFLTCLADPRQKSVKTLAASCAQLTHLNYILVTAKGGQAAIHAQLDAQSVPNLHESTPINKEAYVKNLIKMLDTVLKDPESGPNAGALTTPSAAAWQLDSAAANVAMALSKGGAQHDEYVQVAQDMRMALRVGLGGLTLDRAMLDKGVNGPPTVKALEAVLDSIPDVRIAAEDFPLQSAADNHG